MIACVETVAAADFNFWRSPSFKLQDSQWAQPKATREPALLTRAASVLRRALKAPRIGAFVAPQMILST